MGAQDDAARQQALQGHVCRKLTPEEEATIIANYHAHWDLIFPPAKPTRLRFGGFSRLGHRLKSHRP